MQAVQVEDGDGVSLLGPEASTILWTSVSVRSGEVVEVVKSDDVL